MKKLFGDLKLLALWCFSILKGIGIGLICTIAFFFVALGYIIAGLGVYFIYIIKLAIMICFLAPFHIVGHFTAHTIAGEMPSIGIDRALAFLGLFLMSTLITFLMPVFQLGSLIIDILFLFPMNRLTLFKRLDKGLSVHNWLFEFTDDIFD